MSKEQETFDVMDEVEAPVSKNAGLFIFVHLLAVVYAYIWQIIVTL